ncbi:hypothetical protein OO015_00700 [Thermomicrobium sp. 4228-Ro]|uniref:hypothetical protein n=1 Tax=Thermomicrobium sp. 4228-Ro TaxID=2993937 RepID=UPI002248931A|nr:hypothetical protein [Thermomicrobium sp. 4228-Ro]MCX2726026.1 hypothetical protein [Thermomicrobium sp. 4228-Ro]
MDPLEVLERIRWEILEANGAGEHLWERLSHLGEALELVAVLEQAVEDAIRATAMDLQAWGGSEGDALLEGS